MLHLILSTGFHVDVYERYSCAAPMMFAPRLAGFHFLVEFCFPISIIYVLCGHVSLCEWKSWK